MYRTSCVKEGGGAVRGKLLNLTVLTSTLPLRPSIGRFATQAIYY